MYIYIYIYIYIHIHFSRKPTGSLCCSYRDFRNKSGNLREIVIYDRNPVLQLPLAHAYSAVNPQRTTYIYIHLGIGIIISSLYIYTYIHICVDMYIYIYIYLYIHIYLHIHIYTYIYIYIYMKRQQTPQTKSLCRGPRCTAGGCTPRWSTSAPDKFDVFSSYLSFFFVF